MPTPRAMIRSALLHLGAIAPGETVESGVETDVANALNALLDDWNNDKLLAVYATARVTKVLSASDNQYSIGASGDINVTQPDRVQYAGIIPSGTTLESPIKVLSEAEWASWSDKSSSSSVAAVFFQKSSGTQGQIFLYNIPAAADTLVLYLGTKFSQVTVTSTGLTTDYALPDGCQNALEMSLALQIAPSFEREPSAQLLLNCEKAVQRYKRTNAQSVDMSNDAMLQLSAPNSRLDINAGDY